MGSDRAKRRKKSPGHHPCDKCDKFFTDATYLRKHVARMHTNEKEKERVGKLTCSMCGKQFPRLSHLTRHQVVHLDVREWGCPFCAMNFLQKAHLVKHLERKHAEMQVEDLNAVIEGSRFRGEEVPFGPHLPDDWTGPLPTVGEHLKWTRIICWKCGQTFSTRGQLVNHTEIHHEPMQCERCGETKYGRMAMRAHEGDCSSLQSTLSDCRRNVRRCHSQHQRRSEQASCTFECVHCREQFRHRTALDRHFTARHFTVQSCGECGQEELATPVEARKHARKEHGVYRCGYCSQLTASESGLRKHISIVHWRRIELDMRHDEGIRDYGSRGDYDDYDRYGQTDDYDDYEDSDEEMEENEELVMVEEEKAPLLKGMRQQEEDQNEAEEHEEMEQPEMEQDDYAVCLLLLLPPSSAEDPGASKAERRFPVGSLLPVSLREAVPELTTLELLLPVDVSFTTSILLQLPLPVIPSTEIWNGQRLEIDLRNPSSSPPKDHPASHKRRVSEGSPSALPI